MRSDRSETLDGALRRRAAELPGHVAFRFLPDGETEAPAWTYAQMDARARAIAARLATLQPPGRPVLLACDGGPEPLAAFFGCLYAGMIAVPLPPPRPGQPAGALAAAAADAGAQIGLTQQAVLDRTALPDQLSGTRLRWLAVDALAEADLAGAAAWQPPASAPNHPAALLYTSGSTSQPKGVVLSHQALWGPAFRLPPGLSLLGALNGIQWMPLHHVAGLNTLLLILRVGRATGIFMPAEVVLEQPLRWLRAISRYRAVLAGGPNFLYQLCVERIPPEARAGLDLRRWWFAFCAAEPIRADTLEQFAAAYAPAGFRARAFVAAYGLSEQQSVASGRAGHKLAVFSPPPRVAAFDRAALAENRVQPVPSGAPGAMRLVSNGWLDEGVTVRMVDPSTGSACPAGTVGEVWAASSHMASGYWNQPQATAETFQARLAGSGEGPYLRTGDLGFIYEGELYICGRLKEMIVRRGQNYYAQDIEAAAAGSHADLGSAAAAFALPAAAGADEQVVLYHEVRPGCAQPDVAAISAAIRRAVSRRMQLPLYAVVLVPAGSLPRTALGKVRRYQLREEFLARPGAAADAGGAADP